MKKHLKKLLAGVLALALTLTTLLAGDLPTAYAASWIDVHNSGQIYVEQNSPYEIKYTSDGYSNFEVMVYQNGTIYDYTITVYDQEGKQIGDVYTVSAEDSNWESNGSLKRHLDYFYGYAPGTYYFRVQFVNDADTQTIIHLYRQAAAAPTISSSKETVTVGYTTSLTVKNGTVKSWTSSNEKIATVASDGVVKGKKKGTATITATLENGDTLTCKVSVKANIYSGKKLKKSAVKKGSYDVQPYSAKFNSKGTLIVKVIGINKRKKSVKVSGRISSEEAQKHLLGSFKLTLPAKSKKSYTIKIKKLSLVYVSGDLRTGLYFSLNN